MLPSPSSSPSNNAVGKVGVGMGLRSRAADGSLEVTEIVPNGPVDRSANVKLGDVLLAVDGKDVGQTVASARQLLLGPAGTTVRLVLARTEANAVGSAVAFFGFDAQQLQQTRVEVSVVRAACPPLTPQTPKSGRGVGQENISNNNLESSPIGQPLFLPPSQQELGALEPPGKERVLDEQCVLLQEDEAKVCAERDVVQHEMRNEMAAVCAQRDALQAQLSRMRADGPAELASLIRERDVLSARLRSAEERGAAERQQHAATGIYSHKQEHLKAHNDESIVLLRAELEVGHASLAACQAELESTKAELRQQLINSQADLAHLDQALLERCSLAAAKEHLEQRLGQASAEHLRLSSRLQRAEAEVGAQRECEAGVKREEREAAAALERCEHQLSQARADREALGARWSHGQQRVEAAVVVAERLRREVMDAADSVGELLDASMWCQDEMQESHVGATEALLRRVAEREQQVAACEKEALQMDIIIAGMRTELEASKAQAEDALAGKAAAQQELRDALADAAARQRDLEAAKLRVDADLCDKVAAVSAALQLEVEAARAGEMEAGRQLQQAREQVEASTLASSALERDKAALRAELQNCSSMLLATRHELRRLVEAVEGSAGAVVAEVRCVMCDAEAVQEASDAMQQQLAGEQARLAAAYALTADLTSKSASYVQALEQDKAGLERDMCALEEALADARSKGQAASDEAQALRVRQTAGEDEHAALAMENVAINAEMQRFVAEQEEMSRQLAEHKEKKAKMADQLDQLQHKTGLLLEGLKETQRERDHLIEEKAREQARAEAACEAAQQQTAAEQDRRRAAEGEVAALDAQRRDLESLLMAARGEAEASGREQRVLLEQVRYVLNLIHQQQLIDRSLAKD